ncbi:PREDICTED: GBF-interacting protein 1-like [Camelina sativa]|uniref:GBF-interacting protein 1-like n=1 Tax=Camelina sativa TaxID=90675 RepID=A0ABM0XI45_CAMSA|nr:PREDICTED: GBF-interacting protein 1-like [Camelina sativa]
MVGSGARVSIPASTRKMIQNIKETTAGNYSEDEIHAMLHECNMDPDETAQRLLLQDPFHEVKKKRDKRKENINNKDSAESPWRSGGTGRGSRAGRGNFSSRHASHDVAGAKNSFRKENGPKQVTDPSTSTSQEIKTKDITLVSSHSAVMDKSIVGLTSGSSDVHRSSNLPATSGQLKTTGSLVASNTIDGAPSSVELHKNRVAIVSRDVPTEQKSVDSLPLPRPTSSEVRFTSSNPKSEQTAYEQHVGESKFHARSRGSGKTAVNDTYVPRPASSHSNSTGSRPSSNYSNRSHQTVGTQRGAGSVKEWKPKPVNHNTTQGSGASSTGEALAGPTEAGDKSVENVIPSAEATSRLQRQLEDLQIQRQHVIIPNHILVPEAERTKLSFGSFDAGFCITSSSVACPENEKRSAPLAHDSQEVEESFEEEEFSHPTVHSTEKEEDNNAYLESPSEVQHNMAGEGITATNVAPEYDVSKQDNMLESESNQNSFDHVPSNSNGLVPPAPGSQLPQFENADPQARDGFRIPNYAGQQPFDTASYYAQFYRSGPESDGRISPFVSPGVASKFNGTVLPPHSSQTMQEGGNNLVLSAASPPPLVTQAAGLMQSSIPVTQQHVPVFRPPGLHMSHYPPNYVQYGHYFSPYYLPPPTMHQFLSNGAFAQQPQASGVYPAPPPPGAATGGKYALPHYKPGTNTGNMTHVGMPGGYGPTYGSFPAGYNPTSAASAGNSTSNEDLNSLQLKENNGYNTTGQQSEALPVWIAGPGRDVSSSFYGLQHHGQHVTYAPAQAGHVAFPGMYHPGQAVTAAGVHHPLLQQSQGVAGAEMVAPAPNVFQQPQQTQMNWPSNY